MILTAPRVSASDLRDRTGWELEPEGLCRGDVCVPFRPEDPTDLDLEQVAQRLGMPLLHDRTHGLWALGPQADPGGRFLTDAQFPDLTLPDLDGQPFAFSSLRGRKVVMVAWASW